MHSIIKEANTIGRKLVMAGTTGHEVESQVREYIDSTAYKGLFIHGLGHGIGLELHDHQALGLNANFPLMENMTITVEPGIYVKGLGGVRIEDDVVVTNSGASEMTDITRDLVEL